MDPRSAGIVVVKYTQTKKFHQNNKKIKQQFV